MFDTKLAKSRIKRLRRSIQGYTYDDPDYKLRDQLYEVQQIGVRLHEIDALIDRMERLKFNT